MPLIRYDSSEVNTDAYVTDEGYIRATSVVTRVGVFSYMNSDGSIRKELRLPEDVFNEDALESIKMIPITNGHPAEKLVDSKNAKRLSIGITGDKVLRDGDNVLANLLIMDEDSVRMVKEGNRRELSLGYTVDLLPESGVYKGETYDYRQTNIKYNHLAIVDTARAGSAARIHLDESDAMQINGAMLMAKRKIKIDAMEYMVDPEVADLIETNREKEKDWDDWEEEKERLERNVKNLKDELERVRSELKEQEDKLERVTAEKDAVMMDEKKAEDERKDAADFAKAVSERVKLLKIASSYLDTQTLERLDSASDLEIKKEVIRKAKKNISLDGKSNIYSETLFDVIVADRPSSVNVSNVSSGKVEHLDSSDPESARKKMIESYTLKTKA